MRAITCVLLATLGLGAMADDRKDEKIDAGKLIGKWKQSEEKGKYPTVMEFKKNAIMKATITIEGEDYNLDGKYRIDRNKVVIVLRDDVEHDEVYIVNKLTDKELVWTAELSKQKETFTRLKDK